MDEALRKKYIPMTETTYYTLLSVMIPRHGYAIMQYAGSLSKNRIALGTGTLYTMVGRLTADGIVRVVFVEGKKAYQITETGLELLREETGRLALQLEDGWSVFKAMEKETRGGYLGEAGKRRHCCKAALNLFETCLNFQLEACGAGRKV